MTAENSTVFVTQPYCRSDTPQRINPMQFEAVMHRLFNMKGELERPDTDRRRPTQPVVSCSLRRT
jgi:hypothetical protein